MKQIYNLSKRWGLSLFLKLHGLTSVGSTSCWRWSASPRRGIHGVTSVDFLVAGLILGCSFLEAATIKVPQDQPTIQDAIKAAQDGDQIVIAPGTYTEDLKIGKTYMPEGPSSKLAMVSEEKFGDKPSVKIIGAVAVSIEDEMVFEGILFESSVSDTGMINPIGINVPGTFSPKVMIKDCEVQNYNLGIYADGGPSLIILNTDIRNCNFGIKTHGGLYAYSEKIHLYGSLLENNQTAIQFHTASPDGSFTWQVGQGGEGDVLYAVGNTFRKNQIAIEIEPNLSSSIDVKFYYEANKFRKNGVNVLYSGMDNPPPGIVEGSLNKYD